MHKPTKNAPDLSSKVKEQKGPINLNEQFTEKFRTRQMVTEKDTENMEKRFNLRVMDLQTPKR